MKFQHFTITPLDQKRVHQALDVLKSQFGKHYILREVLQTYLHDDDSFSGKVAFMALDDRTGAFLGTLIAEIVSPETFQASFLDFFDLTTWPSDLQKWDGKCIGRIKSVAVVPSFQRQGIGTQLVKDAIKKLEEHGTEVFYALGWTTKEKGCHIQSVLEALAFRMASQFDHFWYQDSIRRGYSCLSCGYPCQCSMRLFVKEHLPSTAGRKFEPTVWQG